MIKVKVCFLLMKMIKSFGAYEGLTYTFNLGSALGMVLLMQTMSGLMMSLYYEPNSDLAFFSVQEIMMEVSGGWLFRLLHANGASFFFVLIYLHFFKGLFYSSFNLVKVWSMGSMILLFLMAEAFLGYTLVWSQMSFWAGTVITGLLSVIPLVGKTLVLWVWGGFGLSTNTLKFFFVLHFILPFVIILLACFHLFFLHLYGSTSELYCHGDYVKSSFFPYYWIKDLMNLLLLMVFLVWVMTLPLELGDPLGFEEVNSLVSPTHIVPEWYFLWAYGILRAVPSKLFGVLVLGLSVLSTFLFPIFSKMPNSKYYYKKMSSILLIFSLCFLSWLGPSQPEPPYVILSQIMTCFFFTLELVWLMMMDTNYYKD
uniref:Cytochrome b n=1 Tax=Pratylenchus vulnus TaxID=45931 RepID=M1E1L1_PRAVU|nr:cytochrome b [Pratylenchus vulnus]